MQSKTDALIERNSHNTSALRNKDEPPKRKLPSHFSLLAHREFADSICKLNVNKKKTEEIITNF